MIVEEWRNGKQSFVEIPDPEPEPIATPTMEERLEAQVLYTALMTDTLLEV